MRTAPSPQQLDRLFFALSDASRRSMLERLSKGPASASELAGPLAMGLPSAVKHLAVLEEGGLVQSRKAGRVRTFVIEATALQAMEIWVARHKRQLSAQFDRLAGYLDEQSAKTNP